MQPLTLFDLHFGAAEALLKVYRLLDAGTAPEDAMYVRLREVLDCAPQEPVVLLWNDYLQGLVRERAQAPASFFAQNNRSLLLRQAVVSACTAMDVYFPALLTAFFPDAIRIRQRNFLPARGEVKDFFRDFRLRLDEVPALLEEENVDERWNILARRILEYCREKTLSNVDSITVSLLMLGVEDPWRKIAERTGSTESAARTQITNLSKRRNDIVHRGDRPASQPDAEPQGIDFGWTLSHVRAAGSVVTVCDELARTAIEQLRADAGVA